MPRSFCLTALEDRKATPPSRGAFVHASSLGTSGFGAADSGHLNYATSVTALNVGARHSTGPTHLSSGGSPADAILASAGFSEVQQTDSLGPRSEAAPNLDYTNDNQVNSLKSAAIM